jgi:hypothetical protein
MKHFLGKFHVENKSLITKKLRNIKVKHVLSKILADNR